MEPTGNNNRSFNGGQQNNSGKLSKIAKYGIAGGVTVLGLGALAWFGIKRKKAKKQQEAEQAAAPAEGK